MALDLYDRLLADIAAVIQGLSLTGQAGVVGDVKSNVVVQTAGAKQMLSLTYPCILVTNEDQEEQEADWSSFETDGTVYPVLVAIMDQALTNPAAARAVYTGWRRTIATTLRGLVRYPITANCPELITVRMRNLKAIPRGIPNPDRVVSALVAMCEATELRQRNDS